MNVPKNVLDAEKIVSSYLESLSGAVPVTEPVSPQFIISIGYSKLYRVGSALVFSGGMQIDADGAPRCYNPVSSKGLDALGNAGHPGNWWGIATYNGRASGNPVIQGPNDPAPGFYVSTTALEIEGYSEINQRRYVDASIVPFIVLPSGLGCGIKLGDICFCFNSATGDNDFGLYADIGPRGQIGEASIAMASALKVPNSPRTGGVAWGILYVVWPGSGSGYQPQSEVLTKGSELLKSFGGLEAVKELAMQDI